MQETTSKLLELPCNVFYLKADNRLTVLNCNKNQAIANGADNLDKIKNHSLFEFLSDESCQSLKQTVDFVCKQQKPHATVEHVEHLNGISQNYLSIKFPWYDNLNHLIGCYGLEIKLDTIKDLINIAQIFTDLGVQPLSKPEHILDITQGAFIDKTFLSRQETRCIYYIAQGKTAKQIGKILGISYRTVETYIVNLKFKLRCNSRGDLIKKALDFQIFNKYFD